jgi:hypothetical protein
MPKGGEEQAEKSKKVRATFFEKKVAKKLLLPFGRGGAVTAPPRPKGSKSFLLPRAGRLFFKNEVLSCSLSRGFVGGLIEAIIRRP